MEKGLLRKQQLEKGKILRKKELLKLGCYNPSKLK